MSLFNNFFSFFRKQANPTEMVEVVDVATVSVQETPQEVINFVPESPLPHWLQDENQLRDEGVLYGLAGTNPDDKIAVIRSHFNQNTADLEQEKEQLAEKLQELNLFIEQKETRIEDLKLKSKTLEEQQPQTSGQLLRTSIGLLLSLAMCVGNYFLIEEVFTGSFAQSQVIAVGVFLAGMFNLFGRMSLFHERNPLSWQQLLEEIGMPLAAAFFVFVIAQQNKPLPIATAIFVFVLFLFLFAGKLLLSNLTLFRNDWAIFRENLSLKSDKRHKTVEWENEVEKLNLSIDDLRIKKWQILPDLNRIEGELTRIYAQRDMLIQLFESEYQLAKNYRNQISEAKIREILK